MVIYILALQFQLFAVHQIGFRRSGFQKQLPKVGGIAEFCASAQARSAAQKTLLDQDEENDNLIYISCTPWFDLTGCTNERDFDRDDNIPRITWGRYGEENGRKKLGMSVEVNHRFIDGLHLGKFYEKLQADIDAL